VDAQSTMLAAAGKISVRGPGVADLSNGGKAERFKALALPHLDDIYTLARYLLRSTGEADDAVQECYLRAFRHFETFRGGPIKPWLLAILRNVCNAAYVSNRKLVYAADTGCELENVQATPVWREDEDTPEQTILRRHDSETMRRLIEQLPAESREVIVLREINDLSYREIAAIIDVPIGTVMSRLARARGMLRGAWLAAEGEDG
jgi:RNA polymerase sigma-70 factor (ECF subfamily)